jgi:hypothetical protein
MKRPREGSVIHYTPNEIGKKYEDKRIRNSAYFYQNDVQKKLERDKKAWIALAAGNGVDSYWLRDDEEAITPLTLLKRQISEYSKENTISRLALHGIFIPYYHPVERGVRLNIKKTKMRDGRPERVVVVRKSPSKKLIESRLPDAVKNNKRSSYYDPDRAFEHAMGGYVSEPEEDKALKQMRKAGLDKSIHVVFAFVVPFYPTAPWTHGSPPPEHAEQFAPYLKYVIASHTRVKTVVTFDKLSARYVMTGCNYEQMQYKPLPPDYGAPEYKINMYPVSSKIRTVRAFGLKLVHLPHWCMWERGANPELKRIFTEGIGRVQEGMVRSGQRNINAFALMIRAAEDKALAEAKETMGFEYHSDPVIKPTIITEPNQGKRIPQRPQQISRDDELMAALQRAGVSRDADPESIRLVTYDQNIWKIPAHLKQIDPKTYICDCPRCCVGDKKCPWLEYTGEDGVEGCIWCCCKHGHRNPMGECPKGQGCQGWSIPTLRSTYSLVDIANSKGHDIVPWYTDTNIFNPSCDEHWLCDDSVLKPTKMADFTMLFKCKRIPFKFPSLVQLCVEAVRTAALDRTYNPSVLKMHRKAARLPDTILKRWFRPCGANTGKDGAKWLILSGCCPACYFKQYKWRHVDAMVEKYNSCAGIK